MAKSQAREKKRLAKEMPYCHPKSRLSLPSSEWAAAVKTAVNHNPVNESTLVRGAAHGLIRPTIQRIAITTTAYWGPAGVSLPVYFMDGGTQAYKNKVLQMCNNWGGPRGGNVKFQETKTPTGKEVRIRRDAGQGYWSYLGTDILHIDKDEQTMNLDSFTDKTPDSEYLRVVQHEFGHTLGCPHDQLRQAILDLLDPEKVIAEFMRTQGWTRQDVIDQILTPLPEDQLIKISPAADETSIMTYQFPGSVTKNGKPIPGGTDINAEDFALISKAYPKEGTPVPPSPPPPPSPSGTWKPYTPKPTEGFVYNIQIGMRKGMVQIKLTDLKRQLEGLGLEMCKQS